MQHLKSPPCWVQFFAKSSCSAFLQSSAHFEASYPTIAWHFYWLCQNMLLNSNNNKKLITHNQTFPEKDEPFYHNSQNIFLLFCIDMFALRRDRQDCHQCRFCCSLPLCALNTSQGRIMPWRPKHSLEFKGAVSQDFSMNRTHQWQQCQKNLMTLPLNDSLWKIITYLWQ